VTVCGEGLQQRGSRGVGVWVGGYNSLQWQPTDRQGDRRHPQPRSQASPILLSPPCRRLSILAVRAAGLWCGRGRHTTQTTPAARGVCRAAHTSPSTGRPWRRPRPT